LSFRVSKRMLTSFVVVYGISQRPTLQTAVHLLGDLHGPM
jgi:hypothetical protein